MRNELGSKKMGEKFSMNQQIKQLAEINVERSMKGLSPIHPKRFLKQRGGNLGWL